MKLKIFLLIAVSFFAIGKSRAQVPDWFQKIQKLKVAESKRDDVERVYNLPMISQIRKGRSLQIINYELGYGNLAVTYSTGKCSQHYDIDGVDLEEDVVIEIYLFLFQDVEISKLNLDLSKFRKFKSSESSAVKYTDKENGIKYTGGDEIIRSVRYELGNKFDNLECETVLK